MLNSNWITRSLVEGKARKGKRRAAIKLLCRKAKHFADSIVLRDVDLVLLFFCGFSGDLFMFF